MNKLISIGYLGLKKCYLNIPKDVAIARYCKSENITPQEFDEGDISIQMLEFNNEFNVYDVWV